MRLTLATYLAPRYDGFPFALATLASYLSNFTEVTGVKLDTHFSSLASDTCIPNAADQILSYSPNVVGLSCYVWNYSKTLELAKAIRERSSAAFIVVGGPHVSKELNELSELQQTDVINACVSGEGELALWDLLARLANSDSSQSLNGWYEGKSAAINALSSPYQNVRALIESLKASGVAYIEGARGCPFKCAFCDDGFRPAQLRELNLVLSDMSLVYDLGARLLIFLDPTFNYHRDRMIKIVEHLKADLPDARIYAEIKVDLLNDREIDALASVPNSMIEVGLQSSNVQTLKRIQRPTNLAKLKRNVEVLGRKRVQIGVNTIFGLPGECLQDWLATLDFCYGLGDAVITSNCLKVLPNTSIFADRSTYGYDYDQEDLFRATRSHVMPAHEFVMAEKIGVLLQQLQPDEQPLAYRFRREIDSRFEGSLSTFLISLLRSKQSFPSSVQLAW